MTNITVTNQTTNLVLQADFIQSLDKAIHAIVKGQFDVVLLVAFELSTYTEKTDKDALLDYFASEAAAANLADSTIKTLISDTKKIALFASEAASLATLKSKVKSLGITSMSSFIYWLNREHTTKVAIGELTRDNRAAFIATKDNIKNVTDLREWLKGVKEAAAKEAFETRTGLMVKDVGFIDHPSIDHCGVSPDGFVSDGCLIEVKCPKTKTHMKYVANQAIPPEYKPQMLLQSACTGKDVWFVSYDPRMGEGKDLFIKKFKPTPEEIKVVEDAAEQFLAECDALFDFYNNKAVYFDKD